VNGTTLRLSATVVCFALVPGCANESPVDPRIEQGRQLYSEYCALCHGAEGEGYVADNANALANQQFLAVASDELLRRAVARGRPGTTMSAGGAERGGPLSDSDVDAVVAFMRSWQTVPSIDTASIVVGEGVAGRGEALFAVECADCHGADGQGGEFLSVANPEFLVSADDGYLRHVISDGRAGTLMPAFDNTLTALNIDDLVALIRGWAVPPDDGPIELPSTDLGDPVLNPDGEPPAFDGGDLYLPNEEVYEAFDAGARMIFLDSRAPSDYVAGHIPGAVSVPFYDVGEFIDQLPSDEWIVAYCACPHAESTVAANTLINNGYTKVKVLDEGLPKWEEDGYPIKTGAEP